jgi:hypothetical protein
MCDGADVTADSRFAMPAKLPALVEHYQGRTQEPVRFRLPSWEKALADVAGDPTRALSDPSITTEAADERYRRRGDRVVTRDAVIAACQSADMTDTDAVIAAFVLVMAWGSGTSNSRSLRYTRESLRDVSAASVTLGNSATALRRARELADPALVDIHRRFSLPGVGEAFFTKWFTFAGFEPGRSWQPLILDSRVRATLHTTLDVWLNTLTDVRNHPHRYVAYLVAMHQWAEQFPQPMSAVQLEWIMFRHNGKPI